MNKILSLGDCNTLGLNDLKNRSYPERVGEMLGFDVLNCGFTMSTTREAVKLFNKKYNESFSVVTIQFGLVDAYETFLYSPYVLYYPDNIFRKQCRSIVKKYKKLCRNWGFNETIGKKNVVLIGEYKSNLTKIVQTIPDKTVLLIDTVPSLDLPRNDHIKKYNQALDEICLNNDNCLKVDLYDDFLDNLDTFYLDHVHVNDKGYEFISDKIRVALAGII